MGRMTCRRCPGRAGPDYNEPRPRPTPMHRHRVIIGTESTTHTAKTTTLFHPTDPASTRTHTRTRGPAIVVCFIIIIHNLIRRNLRDAIVPVIARRKLARKRNEIARSSRSSTKIFPEILIRISIRTCGRVDNPALRGNSRT